MSIPSISLPDEVSESLAQLALPTGQSESMHMLEAVQNYLDHEAWMASELKQAVKEANSSDFASGEAVNRVFSKYAG